MAAEKLTTTVSSKGQVILPSALRQRREWGAGTRLTVEETQDGVLLKPAPAFAETRPQDEINHELARLAAKPADSPRLPALPERLGGSSHTARVEIAVDAELPATWLLAGIL